MKYDWIDAYLLAKPGVNRDFQEEWRWIRYRIDDKMFCAVCLGEDDKPYYITLKLEPMEGEFLRGQYPDILPGYYMDKRNWNSIRPDGDVPDELMRHMLDQAYSLILAKRPKRRQREILEG